MGGALVWLGSISRIKELQLVQVTVSRGKLRELLYDFTAQKKDMR